MSDAKKLSETVLHDWHAEHGGKMVEFGGWDMPVQYKPGIIREHLSTRRNAGLFDVSHMGRYRFSGAGAQSYLQHALTNTAAGLAEGQAQYTFIANESGGAIDDAYLYKLGSDDFLLVVNAGNRAKDWQWLESLPHSDVHMEDVSEAFGMVSLQGPHAAAVIEELVDRAKLPENKRNRLSTVNIDGHDVVVARTGYTGESVCFELFPPRDFTVELWERLIAKGADPVGLGARDSLRLEAGLPLYGHELGPDLDGNEIPILANALAKVAVRKSPEVDFVGRDALHRQLDEYVRIKRDELNTPVSERALKRLVQPLAVFGARRPLRAGQKVMQGDKPVGYLTSGTTVPFTRFYAEGINALPSDEHDMRPIGLALIDSDIRYRPDQPVTLQVVDDRGNAVDAELVETNLWSTGSYTRAHTGFQAPGERARTGANDFSHLAAELVEQTEKNDRWRREQCINLIPSEQTTSAFVDRLCVADPSGRYNEHNHLKALGPDADDVRYYKGTDFIMRREDELRAALRSFFGCARAEPRVISGQMANDVVYDALKQFRHRFGGGTQAQPLARVLVHDLNKGGHLSAQVGGALKNYVAIDPKTERPAVEHFPLREDLPHAIDADATKRLIADTRPELIVFGRSVIIHKEPVREIARFVHDHFGLDNPARPLIMYDGAHVLGLLGKYFQDPLAEGADVVTGSTHKTFFGPQRGVVLSNIDVDSPFEGFWRNIEARTFPGHVSNHHLGTLLGMLGATYEMLAFKDDYPKQVIANAKALACTLSEHGLSLEGDASNGFTDTHQVLLRGARGQGEYLADLLERNNVITNPQAFYDDANFAAASGVRMGAQEMTRYGMKEKDFERLAGLLADIIKNGAEKATGHWQSEVEAFRRDFRDMQYCLTSD